MNNFQYFVAQFGSRADKNFSQSVALDVTDLPGTGWEILARRHWRTGSRGRPRNDVTDRAHEGGTFTTWRSFEQKTHRRWVWAEVFPVLDSADASGLVPHLRSLLVTNPRPQAKLISEGTINLSESVPENETWAYEQVTEGPGGTGSLRLIGGHVDKIVYILGCSAFDPGWTWPEVMRFASLQASKIQAVQRSGC